MNTLWLDIETANDIDLSVGAHRYAETARIQLFAYAHNDGPVSVIDCTTEDEAPRRVIGALLKTADEIVAHNAAFDRTILEACSLHSPLDKWRCTMAKAMSVSLPGSLGKLGAILGLPQDQQKDKEGRKLMLMFCKPRPKKSKLRWYGRHTHPAEWARYVAYAGRDVESMRAIDAILPAWNMRGKELTLWRLDQKINNRGICVDLELAQAAIRAVDQHQVTMTERVSEMTEGVVESAAQRDKVLQYLLDEYSVKLPDLKATTIENRLENDADLPAEVIELFNLRLRTSTVSTRKYHTLLKTVSSDGRVRGTTQFCGALRTSRWGGRGFQVHNLMRPTMKQPDIDRGIEALKADAADLLFENVMEVAANVTRGVIVAPPGKKLVISDLSNIEGRAQAWLAGEEWKLAAFRAFDAGAGPDLYKMAYAKSFGIAPEDVDDDGRQKGKVQELSMGYAGGVGAFVTFALNYRIDLDEMARLAWDTLPAELKAESIDFHAWMLDNGRTNGLSFKTFVVCDVFKRAWRCAHPAIASYWPELENTIRTAIFNPGETFQARKVKVRRDGAWLRLGLPSGGTLCYPHPAVEDGVISYTGVNQYTRQWGRISSYGGKFFENIAQKLGRDVMADAMPLAEEEGYEIVMHAHDELVAETPDTPAFTVGRLSAMLAADKAWSAGFPLVAAGFETRRYRKDQK